MKVLVVGCDGISWNILDPLIKAGELPTFKKLTREGVRADLLSTIPPQTGPAWVSMLSGVNPGKHGIFDLTRVDFNHGILPMMSTDVRTKRIWDYAARYELDSLVANVPMTYPPQPIRGKMISGFPTPMGEDRFTHPKKLWQRLQSDIGKELNLQPKISLMQKEAFYKELLKITEDTSVTTEYLLKTCKWDLAITVFMATDLASHAFFKREYSLEPKSISNISPMVAGIYKLIDQKLGRLLKLAEENNALIFIVSDHGSVPSSTMFMINSWLLNHGYIKLKPESGGIVRKIVYKLSTLMPNSLFQRLSGTDLNYMSEKKGVEFKKTILNALLAQLKKVLLTQENIDLRQTKALCTGMGGIYVREKNTKLKLKKELENLKDKKTGETIFNVYTAEQLYNGPYVSQGPALVIRPKDEKKIISSRSGGGFWINKLYMSSYPWSGTHRRKGVFLAYGREIKKARNLGDVSIYDVTPTILSTLGLDVPMRMDGRPLEICKRND